MSTISLQGPQVRIFLRRDTSQLTIATVVSNGSGSGVTVYPTETELLAEASDEGAIAYAANTDRFFVRVASAWVNTMTPWRQAVRAATTEQIDLTGSQIIDGVVVVTGDRVLVKDQDNAAENGIYVVAAGAWSRATDAGTSNTMLHGLAVFVNGGEENLYQVYALATEGSIVLGATDLEFTRITASLSDASPAAVGSASAGAALTASRADHVHAHGNQAGGTLHADAIANGADGFMTGTDKAKLDTIAAGAAAVSSSAPENVTKAAASAGVSADAARVDHKHDIATAAPSNVGTNNAEGSSSSLARADHTHAHGTQTDGTMHAAAVASGASGFMTGADKAKLDGIESGAQNNTAANVGAGNGVFKEKSSSELRFKSLVAGTGIALTPSADEIEIAAGGELDVQVFDAVGGPYTWDKPANARYVHVICIGGGGGGGGGHSAAAGNLRSSGAGGGAGAIHERWFDADALDSAVDVTVGAGGAGGAGGGTGGGSGSVGTAGGTSSFGTHLSSYGGGGGGGGNGTNNISGGGGGGIAGVGGNGGTAQTVGGFPLVSLTVAQHNTGFGGAGGGTTGLGNSATYGGGSGGAAPAGATNTAGGGSIYGAGGGGAGGQISAGGSASAPAAGGATSTFGSGGGGAAGVSDNTGATSTAGTDGASRSGGRCGDGGGGGGASGSSSISGKNGGAGGAPGGGGGGGGGGTSGGTATAGTGGAGGRGEVIVRTLCF